ncbi:MAG TPA: lactate utilization protein, partial [Spirochaetota bacterium]|nr:lactate utilization protein [Spirochaetota bacterium]
MSDMTDNGRLLESVKNALESRKFKAYAVSDFTAAEKVLGEIIAGTGAESVAWGGSMTVEPFLNGIRDRFLSGTIIDTQEPGVAWAEIYERRRQALLVDLFVTGANAITEDGEIVNCDAIGNRVGGLSFGPKNVIVIAGRNKITADRESAFNRIKYHAAPLNARRLGFDTPCAKT